MLRRKDPLEKRVIESQRLSVSTDENATLLMIYSPAFYWEFIVLGVGMVMFCIAAVSGFAVTTDGIVFIGISVLALIFVFVFGTLKRTVSSMFDKPKCVLFCQQDGIYSTNLDAGDQEIKFVDIRHVGIKRYVRRYGDTFQVFLVTKNTSMLDITTARLSFSDAQKCAETIREFVGIQEKIQAMD
jgi:hypothetical protein